MDGGHPEAAAATSAPFCTRLFVFSVPVHELVSYRRLGLPLRGSPWEKREVAARGSGGYDSPPLYGPHASRRIPTSLQKWENPKAQFSVAVGVLPRTYPGGYGTCPRVLREAMAGGKHMRGFLPGWRAIRMAPTLPSEGKALAVTSLDGPRLDRPHSDGLDRGHLSRRKHQIWIWYRSHRPLLLLMTPR